MIMIIFSSSRRDPRSASRILAGENVEAVCLLATLPPP